MNVDNEQQTDLGWNGANTQGEYKGNIDYMRLRIAYSTEQ